MRTKFRYFPLMLGILLLIVPLLLAQDMPSKLKSRVVAELGRYYDTPFKITVNDPGIVTITGTAQSYWDKLNVFVIVSRVPGSRKSLTYDRFFPFEKNTVQVQINQGRVTLTGSTTSLWAQHAIEKETRRIQGVREVDNKIEVAHAGKSL